MFGISISVHSLSSLQNADDLKNLNIEDLVTLLVLLMCSKPASVEVAVSKEGKLTVIKFTLGLENKGRVIGRNGHTIKALRSVCRSIERSRGRDVSIEVLDRED